VSGVVVLAERGDGAVALILIRRPRVGDVLWELPRGFEESDDPLADAARELLEETGLVATRLELVGRFHTDSGLLPDHVVVVRAAVADADEAIAGGDGTADDARDVLAVRWWSRAELRAGVARNELRDGITLAALALAGLA
jgi:8-oxo-dGDP phosphatase